MNGYSYFYKELFVRYYTNYLGGTSQTTHSNGRWVRLSTTVCDDKGVGWTELTGSGYAPFGGSQFNFSSDGVAAYGGNLSALDTLSGSLTDIEFTANSTWPAFIQLGVWSDSTSTSQEHFMMGFEFPAPITLDTGETLKFQNQGKAFVDRGLKAWIQSYDPPYAEGPSTVGMHSNFEKSWRAILSWTQSSGSTYPKLYPRYITSGPGVSVYRISVRNADGVGWMEEDPLDDVSVFKLKDVTLSTGFEYYNDALEDGAFKVRNSTDIEFTPVSVLQYANSIGITGSIPGVAQTGIGGGYIAGRPIQIDPGVTPVIPAHNLIMGLI